MQEPESEHRHDHDQDEHPHDHDKHEHDHDKEGHSHEHGHEHGRVDADLYGNKAGLRAVHISKAGMFLVASIQFAIACLGGITVLFFLPAR